MEVLIVSNRKIICPSCNTIFLESLLKQRQSEETCLVCGASLNVDETEIDNESESAQEEELVTWYYYDLGGGSGYLDDVFMEDDENSKLAYTFKAPKELEAAKEVLRKEYDPTAFAPVQTKPDPPTVKCPHCGSSDIQLIPKRWSFLTGYRTNAVSRCCVNCKHRF